MTQAIAKPQSTIEIAHNQDEEVYPFATPPDFEAVSLIILSAVARMQGRRGLHIIVDVLLGAKNKKVTGPGFHELSVHGLLRGMPRPKAVSLIKELLEQQLLARGDHDTLGLTTLGKAVMTGHQPLPPPVYLAMELAYDEASSLGISSSYRQGSPTLRKTLRLMERGFGPEDIADSRGLSVSTVISHLMTLADRGAFFDLGNHVDDDLLEKLRPLAIDWSPGKQLSPIREALLQDVENTSEKEDSELEWQTLKLHLLYLFIGEAKDLRLPD